MSHELPPAPAASAQLDAGANTAGPFDGRDLIVYIHGFDVTGQGYGMPKLARYVDRHVAGAGACRSWSPLFNSRDHTFVSLATQLMQRSAAALPTYRRRFAVCHSMGGVIARQMMLLGANFDAVVTINSPHEGTALWTAWLTWFISEGSRSLLPISADLGRLNAQDAHLRRRYHFVGVWYHGNSPGMPPLPHDNHNDTLIERTSQTGDHLAGPVSRYAIRMDYGVGTPPQALLGVGAAGDMCPHNTLVNFPDGDNPMAGSDTSALAVALRRAIR